MRNQAMTNKNNKFSKYGHLSLGVAVSSILLTACAAPQVKPPVTKNSAILQPNGNYQYGTGVNRRGLLDEESLAELADLLEAQDMTMVENDQNTINQVGDLWGRIRNGYGIQRVNAFHPRIEAQKSWFMYNQDHLNKMTARASRYLYYTVSEAERRGIPLEFALLPIIESSYDPSVTSKAKAAGIWQFIPSTGRMYGLKQTSNYDGRRDVIESTEAAYSYLASLYNQFGDWELALAAYNAGPTRVQRAINANIEQGKPTDFWSLNLPKETMNYVPRFLAVNEIISNPTAHNLYLPAIANKQHLNSVPVAVGVKLRDVAIVSGVPLTELQNLNAGMLSGKVEKNSPQRVIVPSSINGDQIAQIQSLTKDNINSLVANNKNNQAKPFVRKSNGRGKPKNKYRSTYVVQPNDTLESIAKRAGITSKQLAQWNDLSPNAILLPNTRLSLYDATYLPTYNKAKSQRKKPFTPLRTNNTNKAKQGYYIVKSGDTLTGTARKFGLSTKQLASYNNLSANALLLRGQRLWLVPGKVKATTTNNKVVHTVVPNNSQNNHTTRYQVQSGETLSGIARRHHTTVSTLASLNGVDVNYKVKWGEYLVVPSNNKFALNNVSVPTTGCSTATHSRKAPLKVMSTAKNSRVAKYKVRSGDTLTSVANSFGLSIHDLAVANGLSVNSQLKRYSTITIPAASCPLVKTKRIKSKKVSTVTSKRSSRSAKPTSMKKYRVQSGDSLTSLARKYNVSVPELARLNKLSATTDLLIGQMIKVPSNSGHSNSGKYTVRSGDSLTNLANRYSISIQKLAKLNGLSTDAMLRIGQVIKVPR